MASSKSGDTWSLQSFHGSGAAKILRPAIHDYRVIALHERVYPSTPDSPNPWDGASCTVLQGYFASRPYQNPADVAQTSCQRGFCQSNVLIETPHLSWPQLLPSVPDTPSLSKCHHGAGGGNQGRQTHQCPYAVQARGSGETLVTIAKVYSVGVSTLKAWIDEAKSAKSDEEEVLPYGPNTVYREQTRSLTQTWLRELYDHSDTPSISRIVDELRVLEPDRVVGKSYGALCKIAERMLSAVKREAQQYNAIRRSIGVERLPLRRYSRRCRCKESCDECPSRGYMTECADFTCHLGQDCGNRAIQQGTPVKFIRSASDSGRGNCVAAVGDIHKGQFVQEYVGVVINKSERARLHEKTRSIYVAELAYDFL